MAVLTWDEAGNRLYETGVSNLALFVHNGTTYGNGIAWNGVTAITESADGGEPSDLYADNVKYLSLTSKEDFKLSIEAYNYPVEFLPCLGYHSIATGVTCNVADGSRSMFGVVYKTLKGSDTLGNKKGYKLHVVYGCLAAPSEKAYATISDSPEAITFSWDIATTPVDVAGFKPTAHIEIDSNAANAAKFTALEGQLYGDASHTATLLTPAQIIAALT